MGTMAFVQCNSCGGVYPQTQADGTVYYHACPDHVVSVGAVVDPATGKTTVPPTLTPIANPRDENVLVGADGKVTNKRGDPNGFTPAKAPPPPAPFDVGA